MGSWQSKILFTLIVFGAGFVTAVYFLVPPSAAVADQTRIGEMSTGASQANAITGHPDITSQAWAVSVRSGIDICIRFAEEYALRAADVIRVHTGQGTPQSD